MFQKDLFQKRLSFLVADSLLCAKSRKARSHTVNMQLQVPVVVPDADAHLCLLQYAGHNIRSKADNLWCSLSRKVPGSVEVVSSPCPAGPVNAVSKASIDHTQVTSRGTSPPLHSTQAWLDSPSVRHFAFSIQPKLELL